jgi:N-acetylmuramoyl-L-alanine amidase
MTAMSRRTSHGALRRFLTALCLGLGVSVGIATPAAGQTAATLYARANGREQAARARPDTTAPTFRSIARAYEAVVRRYPRSGYADNALWQSAALWLLAADHSGDRQDRVEAQRALTWLSTQYPTSALARDARVKLARLAVPPAAAAPTPTPTAAVPAPLSAAVPVAAPAVAPSRQAAAPAVPIAASETHGAAADGPTKTLTAAAVGASDGSTMIRSISRQVLPKGDRIVIELGTEQPYAVTRAANPDRLVVRLLGAGVSPAAVAQASNIGGVLVHAATASTVARGSELVLALTGAPRYSTFPLYNPFRLVIDVESDRPVLKASAPSLQASDTTAAVVTPAPSKHAAAVAPPERTADGPLQSDAVPLPAATPAAATTSGNYSLSRQLGLRVARVVIDPGHGGHDPGAQANGVTEADVVLDIALRVEKILSKHPGVDVVLTRRTNEFIPLEERTAIANREGADLFLSIHANASRNTSARGVETFFLNFASNPQAEAVAARENATSAETMGALPQLVKTITMNDKLAESRELATMAQQALVGKVAPASHARDLGVRQAPFVVLIGAQMPSILAEVSFVTNRTEAALLKQASYRQRIAQALANAVLQYQSSLKAVPAVASKH